MVKALINPETPVVKKNALGTLLNLAALPANQQVIADAGAIPYLVKALSNPKTPVA